MKIRVALSDIEKILEDAVADRKFVRSQILFWILTAADSLKSKHVAKIDSGAFVHPYFQIHVYTDNLTGRKYFDLPTGIYDFDKDEGINYLSYDYTVDPCSPAFTSVTFTRTTPSKAERLYYTEEETPSPENPYFYRLIDRVWLLGIECIDVNYLEGGFYSTFDLSTSCSLDDELEFPNELYDVLKAKVLSLARWSAMIPQNRLNNGNWGNEEVSEVQGAKQKQQPIEQTDTTQ